MGRLQTPQPLPWLRLYVHQFSLHLSCPICTWQIFLPNTLYIFCIFCITKLHGSLIVLQHIRWSLLKYDQHSLQKCRNIPCFLRLVVPICMLAIPIGLSFYMRGGRVLYQPDKMSIDYTYLILYTRFSEVGYPITFQYSATNQAKTIEKV